MHVLWIVHGRAAVARLMRERLRLLRERVSPSRRRAFRDHHKAVRQATKERDTAFLAQLLTHPMPGVRRAAARALGQLGPAPSLLLEALRLERSDTVVAALGGAALRAGADQDAVLELIARHRGRCFATSRGLRCPSRITGTDLGRLPTAVWWEVGRTSAGTPCTSAETVDALCTQTRLGPERLTILACQLDDRVEAQLEGLGRASGRRLGHAWLAALGWSGSPRWERTLRSALQAVDRDPSHAFATRRTAAAALGRLGNPAVATALAGAMHLEATDHEGRPGAGLGVQFPTRAAMVWALGEAGAVEAAPALIGLLQERDGVPTGALDLAAADALWKLGPAVHALVEESGAQSSRASRLTEGILGDPRV